MQHFKCVCVRMWHEITYKMTIIQRKWTLNTLHCLCVYMSVSAVVARDVIRGQLSTSVFVLVCVRANERVILTA